jgi:Icc-related predicted phosphoesterase
MVPVDPGRVRYDTMTDDLVDLAGDLDLSSAVFLFHTPPADTTLDRVARDGMMVDHVPLDLHVGSIAVRRFIEERQPLLTLHGHIHESAGLTGQWRDRIGSTQLFGAAHDGPELCLVSFHLDDLSTAERELI